MIRHLFVAVAMTMASFAWAGDATRTIPFQDVGDAIVIPAGSFARYKTWNKEEITATFEGRFVLDGRFEIPEGDGDPVIFPDPDALKRMPHWRDRGGPDYVYIRNPLAFEKAIQSAKDFDRLHRHKLKNLSGRVSAVVENYSAAIECDSPVYEVTFVAIAKPTQFSSNQKMDDVGC